MAGSYVSYMLHVCRIFNALCSDLRMSLCLCLCKLGRAALVRCILVSLDSLHTPNFLQSNLIYENVSKLKAGGLLLVVGFSSFKKILYLGKLPVTMLRSSKVFVLEQSDLEIFSLF